MENPTFYCKFCDTVKPIEGFVRNKNLNRGHDNICVECNRKRLSKYTKTYEQQRNADLKHNFGINNLEELEQLLLAQNYQCKICGEELHLRKVWPDHDHKTNKLRGLLCFSCNAGLGQLSDGDISIIEAAIRYLANPPAEQYGIT